MVSPVTVNPEWIFVLSAGVVVDNTTAAFPVASSNDVVQFVVVELFGVPRNALRNAPPIEVTPFAATVPRLPVHVAPPLYATNSATPATELLFEINTCNEVLSLNGT